MKTLLDLIQEYAMLSDAKTLARGALPPAQEARWQDLKRFYDMVMAQNGLARDPASRFTAVEIRERVSERSRLRIATDLEIVVAKDGAYHRARMGNLSCGGALLFCDEPFAVKTELTIHMANLSRGASVLPTEARVVWRSAIGQTDATFGYRMGVQFTGLGPDEQRSLDSFIVDSLETKLLCLGRESLDPEFLRKEQVSL